MLLVRKTVAPGGFVGGEEGFRGGDAGGGAGVEKGGKDKRFVFGVAEREEVIDVFVEGLADVEEPFQRGELFEELGGFGGGCCARGRGCGGGWGRGRRDEGLEVCIRGRGGGDAFVQVAVRGVHNAGRELVEFLLQGCVAVVGFLVFEGNVEGFDGGEVDGFAGLRRIQGLDAFSLCIAAFGGGEGDRGLPGGVPGVEVVVKGFEVVELVQCAHERAENLEVGVRVVDGGVFAGLRGKEGEQRRDVE